MTARPYKERTFIPDKTFPINVFHTKRIGLHWHDHMEWIFVKEGRARMQIDGDAAVLQQGELVFVNAKQVHGATALADGTALVAIVFNEALLRNSGLDSTDERYFSPMASHRLQLPNFLKAEEPLTKEIGGSVARLIAEFEAKASGYELLIKAELFRIFGLVFRYDRQLAAKPGKPGAGERDLTSLLQYIRGRSHEPVTLRQAAAMVNMSPNHFCSRFKKATGKTWVEYIHLLRVNEAERLLRETEWPVTAIADKVGFDSIAYFGRVFKKVKGVTPTGVRRMRGGSGGAG